jgi:2-polyprenyl-6-methoxyphenol hydroxylase-like FAD-dependent oxidoreductase
MNASKPITIVGGGLAGLSLGIGLCQRGVRARIFEAGHYPRHRVCGEFISGRGLEVLDRLGLRERFLQTGAQPAKTAAFFSARTSSPLRTLAIPALCLSRYAMDELLAKEFRRLGGELIEQTRWTEATGDECIVRASGRRLQPIENGWRWFGLKVHARGVALIADLEMHASRFGYVGLCRLNSSLVNVCGLFRRCAENGGMPRVDFDLLRGEPGTILNERLENAKFDESSFSAVAGLSLHTCRATQSDECRIGDALTMIPPVTGNGMSIALESAEMAIEPLSAFSQGKTPWTQTKRAIARRCDKRFARRLAWARLLQWLMFAVVPRKCGRVALSSNLLWQLMFKMTR